MINKDFLAGCSAEQISRGVAWLEASKLNIFHIQYDSPWKVNASGIISSYGRMFFSCHNPNDTMPIAVRYGMSIELPHVDLGYVGTISLYVQGDTDISIDFTGDQNYLRAICEVYILMSVAKVTN